MWRILIMNKVESKLPSFNMTDCLSYFTKVLTSANPKKIWNIPTWIPKLAEPRSPFNLSPPTYEQVTAVIRKMKASGSPCPLDQISVICFKCGPFLRTFLTEIIQYMPIWFCSWRLENSHYYFNPQERRYKHSIEFSFHYTRIYSIESLHLLPP